MHGQRVHWRHDAGSSGIAVVVFPKERFRWIRGEDFRG